MFDQRQPLTAQTVNARSSDDSLNALYIVGGAAKPSSHKLPEWHKFERGLVLRLSLDTGRMETAAEYVSPREVCAPENPSVLFKAATLVDDTLYTCTNTEVLVYSVPEFKIVNYISLHFFNDLHHVAPSPWGTLLVAVTGLDMVVELTQAGELLRQWDVMGGDTWDRFERGRDYRRVATTKPHQSHPNFVFFVHDQIWATRHHQCDAVCLTDDTGAIRVDVEKPHDGEVIGDRVYFTTVDGHVVVTDPSSGRLIEAIDLRELAGADRPLGWCRGLQSIDDDVFVVGFSRLRTTRFTENVAWVRRQLKGMTSKAGDRNWMRPMPSRVACFDLKRRRLLWEQDIESHGMNAVFSIN